jgi:Fur family peroxide stress response transcriptional regulator
MPVAPVETARRVESLSAALRAGGLRLTHQRLEVVREIAGTDEHPDARAVHRAVRRRVPTISPDTVYRTLGALSALGLLGRVEAGGPARYDAKTARHHHFVCTRCGLVRDVEDSALDAWVPAPVSALPGRVESIEVQFKGVCRQCQPAAARPARANGPRRAIGSGNGASQRKERRR